MELLLCGNVELIEPYDRDEWTELYNGDAMEVLNSMADGTINCVVTSPPYW